MTLSASVILITKNESARLFNMLSPLKEFGEVIVVDSESTDTTREIAVQMGAKVFVRSFDDFSSQKNFALAQATQPWVLSLDADETPDTELVASIRTVVQNQTDGIIAYQVRRKNIHFGRELKWGGQSSDAPLRLFRRDRGHFIRPIHEVIQVDGKTGVLKGTLIHETNASVEGYLKKLVQYTTLEARLMKEQGKKPTFVDWAIKPALRFVMTYFLKLGFLDGYEGLLFHALSSFYYSFKYVRLKEMACG